jgi:hypothetical protein
MTSWLFMVVMIPPTEHWTQTMRSIVSACRCRKCGILLWHASIQMTERYAHLAPENVRRAVERIEGLSRLVHASQNGEEQNAA